MNSQFKTFKVEYKSYNEILCQYIVDNLILENDQDAVCKLISKQISIETSGILYDTFVKNRIILTQESNKDNSISEFSSNSNEMYALEVEITDVHTILTLYKVNNPLTLTQIIVWNQ